MKPNEDTITIVIDKVTKRKIRMISSHDGRTINNWFNHTFGKTFHAVIDGQYAKVVLDVTDTGPDLKPQTKQPKPPKED